MSLLESLSTMFAIILLGIVCEKKKMFTVTQTDGFQIFLYKIGTPCFLFTSILHQECNRFFHTGYIYSYLGAFLIMTGIVSFFYRKETPSEISLKILASSYANKAMYTIPVVTFLLSDPIAGVISNFLQVIVIQSIFIVFLSLINHKEKSITKKLIGIISTPLVIMPIIGLFLNIWSIEPHPLMISIIKTLGVGSPSLALFSFGLTLGSVKIKKETITREILWIVFLKNFLHPFIAFCVGKYAFDLEEYWLYSLVIATSAPTAFVVYILGKQFSKDTHWMKTVLAITAIISAISLVMISLIKGAF